MTGPLHPPAPPGDPGENGHVIQTLARLIQLSKGQFALALVEFDLPSCRDWLISSLRAEAPDSRIVVAEIDSDLPYLIGQRDLIAGLREQTGNTAPDAILALGIERILSGAVGAAEQTEPEASIIRAIQPLNLGRNVLAQTFACPVLIALPAPAMSVFLRLTPDLSSWRSGYFRLTSAVETIREKIRWEGRQGPAWPFHKRSATEKDLNRLCAVIEDALALDIGHPEMAGLYRIAAGMARQLRNASVERWALRGWRDEAWAAQDYPGGRAAGKRLREMARRLSTVMAGQLTPAAARVFRGAAPLCDSEPAYGRQLEVREMIARLRSPQQRLLILWGKAGCGKTSLLEAGVLPELHSHTENLVAIVRGWHDPNGAVRDALQSLAPEVALPSGSLLAAVRAVTASGKTLYLVLDQFEQFFRLHLDRAWRETFYEQLSHLARDYGLACRLVLVIQEEVGRLTELERQIPSIMEAYNRFALSSFSVAQATLVGRQLSELGEMQWPPDLLDNVAKDLSRDGEVHPGQLKLVTTAMAFAGIDVLPLYQRAGGAETLLRDYLDLAISSLRMSSRRTSRVRRVLSALTEDRWKWRAVREIAGAAGLNEPFVARALKGLQQLHLVQTGQGEVYRLTQDLLADLLKSSGDRHAVANKALRLAVRQRELTPQSLPGLRDTSRILFYADWSLSQREDWALIWRAVVWNGIKSALAALAAIVVLLIAIQLMSCHLDASGEESPNVLIRRGLPALGGLPLLRNAVLIDSGIGVAELNEDGVASLHEVVRWSPNPSTTLRDIIPRVTAPWRRGSLWCMVGGFKDGLRTLTRALSNADQQTRDRAAEALGEICVYSPDYAVFVAQQLHDSAPPVDSGVKAVALGRALMGLRDVKKGGAPEGERCLLELLNLPVAEPKDAWAIRSALAAIASEYREGLLAVFRRSPESTAGGVVIRWRAAQALSSVEVSRETGGELASFFLNALTRGTADQQLAAAEALSKTALVYHDPIPRIVPQLLNYAESRTGADADSQRAAAISSLAEILAVSPQPPEVIRRTEKMLLSQILVPRATGSIPTSSLSRSAAVLALGTVSRLPGSETLRRDPDFFQKEMEGDDPAVQFAAFKVVLSRRPVTGTRMPSLGVMARSARMGGILGAEQVRTFSEAASQNPEDIDWIVPSLWATIRSGASESQVEAIHLLGQVLQRRRDLAAYSIPYLEAAEASEHAPVRAAAIVALDAAAAMAPRDAAALRHRLSAPSLRTRALYQTLAALEQGAMQPDVVLSMLAGGAADADARIREAIVESLAEAIHSHRGQRDYESRIRQMSRIESVLQSRIAADAILTRMDQLQRDSPPAGLAGGGR